MRVLLSVLTLALALTGYGCDADRGPSTPISPTPPVVVPPTTPTPGPAPNHPGDLWSLTTTVVSLEGSACFWPHPVGKTFVNSTLSVERNEPQVRFVYDVNNVHDNLSFVGTVNEHSFAAASGTYSSGWQCAPHVTISSSVVGTFSSDDRTLTGLERLTYRVVGGNELTITLEWNATRM